MDSLRDNDWDAPCNQEPTEDDLWEIEKEKNILREEVGGVIIMALDREKILMETLKGYGCSEFPEIKARYTHQLEICRMAKKRLIKKYNSI